jgi:heme-degrading monooxygenase HmoA
MIARIWQGVTSTGMADGYLEYLHRHVIPAYQEARGNAGLFVLKEPRGELVHFLLLSFWSSEDSLASFVGADLEVMKLGAEEKSLLVAFESMAKNYKIVCKAE